MLYNKLAQINRNLCFGIILIISLQAVNSQNKKSSREEWLNYMDKLAKPVMQNLANDNLKNAMPIMLSKNCDDRTYRSEVAYLEAFARLLCGISPWIDLEGGSKEETKLRNQYRKWSISAIANAVNPDAKDYMKWEGYQPLVDASFFALALIRCPWIWNNIDSTVKSNIVIALNSTRKTIPVYTNWILFSSMIEAFFCKYDLPYDAVRIEYGIREFSEHWYVGDGMFSDGMDFALDYYNSYVIQPYLINIINAVKDKDPHFNWFIPKLEKITARYAEIQERSINSDGSFPVFGRSIVYRGGAFHQLADMSLNNKLPENIKPAQVRCALTAVINKTMNASNTFNEEGWLNIGLYGKQENLADRYINSGSGYLCSVIFLPLGLPENDTFWIYPEVPWTAKKVWNGIDIPPDHSYNEK